MLTEEASKYFQEHFISKVLSRVGNTSISHLMQGSFPFEAISPQEERQAADPSATLLPPPAPSAPGSPSPPSCLHFLLQNLRQPSVNSILAAESHSVKKALGSQEFLSHQEHTWEAGEEHGAQPQAPNPLQRSLEDLGAQLGESDSEWIINPSWQTWSLEDKQFEGQETYFSSDVLPWLCSEAL